MDLHQQARAHLIIQALVLPTIPAQALLHSLAQLHHHMLPILMQMAIRSSHGSKISHLDLHQPLPPSFLTCTSIVVPSVLQLLLH